MDDLLRQIKTDAMIESPAPVAGVDNLQMVFSELAGRAKPMGAPFWMVKNAVIANVEAAVSVGLTDQFGAELIHFQPRGTAEEEGRLLASGMRHVLGNDAPFDRALTWEGRHYALVPCPMPELQHPELHAIVTGLGLAMPALIEMVEVDDLASSWATIRASARLPLLTSVPPLSMEDRLHFLERPLCVGNRQAWADCRMGGIAG